jgi:hypothetical protein
MTVSMRPAVIAARETLCFRPCELALASAIEIQSLGWPFPKAVLVHDGTKARDSASEQLTLNLID